MFVGRGVHTRSLKRHFFGEGFAHFHLDTIASLNWAPVRVLEAFIAGNCVEFRSGSNGAIPGPRTID